MVIASYPTQRPPILVTGQIVDDRYRILAILAEGGMGTVFLGEHVLIGRRVAIKVLHRELAHDTSMVKRFMNEALAAGTLGHPNIVEATDMGFTPDRVPYIVYEYLEGSLLTEEIYRVHGLPVRRAIRIAIQIASALEAAHNAGIVHLDLKSDNVFLTDKDGALDHVKVLDFGISRFMDADCETTQRGLVMGTPEFMAPEQVTSPDTVDKRADIYALGVVLYEMIAARRPYGGDDPRVLLYRICNEPPPPLDREVAPELEQLLFERLLAKERDRRFSSMKEVIAALEGMLQIVRTGDSLAELAGFDWSPAPAPAPTPEPEPEPESDVVPQSTGMGAVWVVLAVMLAMAGGAVYLVADRIASSTNDVATAALEANAEQIAALLTSQARVARTRAADAGPVRVESRVDGVWLVAGGTATPVDFTEIKRRLAEDAVEARLVGLGAPIDLVSVPGAVLGRQLTLPLPPLPELETRDLTLHATIAPITRGGTFRQASYACFGVAGVLLLGSIVGRMRRRRVVVEAL
jgi:tRNA A-37 threonylcarbamoyl transferase component Bud32